MSDVTNAVVSVPITPVVSWPREALPGERYLVTVDLRVNDLASWPYEDEEYVVALMLSGRNKVEVSALGDTSVVLHRFGGTYGPAQFVMLIGDEIAPVTEADIWLTLISAGGVPFHTVRLPFTVTSEATVHPSTVEISPVIAPVRPLAASNQPPTRLPFLMGTEDDAWSVVAFADDLTGPVLAIGTDAGTLRVWWPSSQVVHTYEVGGGRTHVVALRSPDGQPCLLAASGRKFVLVDPASGATLDRFDRPDFDAVTAITLIEGARGDTEVAVGTSSGLIHLLRIYHHREGLYDVEVTGWLTGHNGAVFSMVSLEVDHRSVLASGGGDSSIFLWDTRTYQRLTQLTGHTAQINHLSVVDSADGRPYIASASDDGTVRLWNTADFRSVQRWEKEGDWINVVIQLPKRLSHPALLWGGREGVLRTALQGVTGYLTAAENSRPVTMLTAFHWDDRHIVAVASAGGEITLRYAADFEVHEHKPPRSQPPRSRPESAENDAVIVIPNVLGSELIDTETGKLLWGMSGGVLSTLSTWISSSNQQSLRVTDEERAGHTGRVRATRLLRMPALMPGFASVEPYATLMKSLQSAVRHPEAVLEFPYDWRLSVAHNARLLAATAERHLDRWRSHPEGSAGARLILVAHGEGGLIARAYTNAVRDSPEIRLTVGIGVPYYGTIKALEFIAGSSSNLLSRHPIRKLAATMPGFYDLLPFYRCLEDGSDIRRLEPSDVARFGGDQDLARMAISYHRQQESHISSGPRLDIVGIAQPTPQSVRLERGSLVAQDFLPALDESGSVTTTDYGGDGTVPRFSAVPPGDDRSATFVVSQTAGALCRDHNVIAMIMERMMAYRALPPL
jgi:WD40 repeat protein